MRTSARNQFSGTIREITKGPVSAEVTIEVGSGINIVAVISSRSADALGLRVGKPAQVLIKASNVIVAVD